jgi:galactitol-specific phosphotransferase system IIC component
MRAIKLLAIMALVVVGLSVFCLAALNQYGVADVQQVTFSDPIKVGGVMLPKGDYRVEHTMQGEDHIMVFTQMHSKTPAVAKAKCDLVKLEAKAVRTEVLYNHPDADTHVLQELVFKGELAKHVF